MLQSLSIRNFVIVDTLELEFSAGFTALTGETGAGKSILIDALELALGGRSESGMLRAGCERAEIAACFDVSGLAELQAWLDEQDLTGDHGLCLMRRTLDDSGRSRGFINGRAVTLQQMREAGDLLLDVHGQHAHQSLLRSDAQRALLDRYAGADALLDEVGELYRRWQAVRKQRLALEQDAAGLAAERELLVFQTRELEQLDFTAERWAEEQAEHARLSNAAGLLETAALGLECLSEADTACLPQLAALSARLETAARLDGDLAEPMALLTSAQAELQEVVYALRQYQRQLEADPQRLDELERRIGAVIDCARKYRIQPEALPELHRQLADRLAALGEAGDADVLAQREAAAQADWHRQARRLSELRAQAAERLGKQISAAMQGLAMNGGRFEARLVPLASGSAHGLEDIEFQVSANPGSPLRPLARTASGGELARISLAIQVALSGIARVPTLIFDEVDSGIGGSVAEIVGRLLKQLGQRHQVLCVTHLPQVAAAADQQWQVSKSSRDGATLSRIVPLDQAARIEEIARMLGGVTLTDTTRRHAAEMLGCAV